MFVTTSTSKTFYQDMGQGKVIVLLHGWGCDWQIWAPQIRSLSDEYRLIIPDLPIFGQSRITDKQVWDTQNYVDWLAEFLEQILNNNETYVLVGHSFGGKIASVFAATHASKQLKSLVIVDASGLPVELTAKEQLTQNISSVFPSFVKNIFNSSLKTKVLQKVGIADDYQHATPEQKEILKKIVRENITKELQNISVDTHVLWGKNDEATPIEKGREFAQLIPNAKFVEFTESGHYPFLDEAARFNQVLSDIVQ